jgi:hypothetical protein
MNNALVPPPLPPFMAYEAVIAYDAVPNSEPVIPPFTLKLPVAEMDPEVYKEPENTSVSAFAENTVVPAAPETAKLPVIDSLPITVRDPVVLILPDIVEPLTTLREFNVASEPDTMTFFQFGIPMF